MNNQYYVSSNRESGEGRYDILLKAMNRSMPGFLIELKVLRDVKKTDDIVAKLKKFAKEAADQINTMNYAMEMINEGIKKIFKIGIAFYKKQVEICVEE